MNRALASEPALYGSPCLKIHTLSYYTMAFKPSSRQQAQLAFLQMLPPKFQRIHNIVEQMSTLRADESVVRSLGRLLDEIKGNAAALSLSGIADTAGIMGTMVRRGGGVQMKCGAYGSCSVASRPTTKGLYGRRIPPRTKSRRSEVIPIDDYGGPGNGRSAVRTSR
jgi:hypothetical protein